MLVCTVRHRDQLRHLAVAPSDSQLGRLRATRPELYGMVLTPFMTANWQARQRFDALRMHCRIVDRLGSPFDLGDDDDCEILAFDDLAPLSRVTLTTRRWRFREGLLTLNLCTEDRTAFALSFILSEQDGHMIALIGGMQGANFADSAELNRQMTKVAHGMRPKDLLIDIFRALCRAYDIGKIIAVSDANRNQRSKYSLNRARGRDSVNMSYDASWIDRGGVPDGDGFFDLPIQAERRAVAEMPSNKRSMYRRRYEMLDAIDEAIRAQVKAGLRVRRHSALDRDTAESQGMAIDPLPALGDRPALGMTN